MDIILNIRIFNHMWLFCYGTNAICLMALKAYKFSLRRKKHWREKVIYKSWQVYCDDKKYQKKIFMFLKISLLNVGTYFESLESFAVVVVDWQLFSPSFCGEIVLQQGSGEKLTACLEVLFWIVLIQKYPTGMKQLSFEECCKKCLILSVSNYDELHFPCQPYSQS